MADKHEEEDVQSLKLKHSLLIGLKTTVEGLLASHTSNVWNTYGGLSRLCKDVERILNHRLKFVAGDFGSVVDFWPFVKGLKWLSPVLTPFIEKIRKGSHQKGVTKGQVWVRESLREHNLVKQLKVLVTSDPHLHRHYFEDAFLYNPAYFDAACLCLQAVEENRVSLLADIDVKLLSLNVNQCVTPSHIRSASLPVSPPSGTYHLPRRTHRASHSDAMDLAPPFASPSRESFLCRSDEHAVPCSNASSTSPDDSRVTAREALRSVLRKSGSDSPPGLSPPNSTPAGYSLYDSLNTDPLLNIDFIQGTSSSNISQSMGNLTNKEKDKTNNGTISSTGSRSRTALTRSTSENVVQKRYMERRASEMMDKMIIEDEDNVFPVTKSLTLQKAESKEKLTKVSRVIFSDSESIEQEVKAKSSKNRQNKMTHKRSRSDISGIKIKKEEETSNGIESRKLKETYSVPNTVPDEVDGGNGGFFPQPVQGQSLLHFLSSQDFHTCANLDKENAHFSICEALIAAIEQMKWNHILSPHTDTRTDTLEEEDSDEEIKELQQRIRIRKRERLKEKAGSYAALSDGRTGTTPSSGYSLSESPVTSHDSDYSDSEESSGQDDKQIELTMESRSNLTNMKETGLSLSMASLYSDADIQKSVSYLRDNSVQESGGSYLSAESVAISLLRKFSEKQLPKASDLQWLVTEQQAPQRLLPLPNSYPVSPDDADKTDRRSSLKPARTRIRGNMEWAPPRPQIIFNIHPAQKRSSLLTKQNYMCAGCGMRVEPGYAKRYRYCEYLGKYFCQCCHSNHTCYTPSRILKRWDFTKYYVSNFAEDFLTKIHNEPLFNVSDINPGLYRKVKLLTHLREYRTQLKYLKSLLSLCKQATSISSEIGRLPSHWLEDEHTYSLADLISIKSGAGSHIYSIVKNLTTDGICHVESCQFCQCFGFICEVCRNASDVIFPYQLHKVTICQGCKTCFHQTCFDPKKCPKCARIDARKKIHEQQNTEDFEEESPTIEQPANS